MAMSPYFGTYGKFTATSKECDYALMSSNSIVGDICKVAVELNEKNEQVVKLYNRFDQELGVIENHLAYKILLFQADKWEIRPILSCVYYCKEGNGGYYEGEIALICFSLRYSEEFETFTKGISVEIAGGRRPLLKLNESTVQNIIKTGGKLVPKDKEARLKLPQGASIVKDHIKADEKMVELARKKNPGCMFVGYAFIVVLILAVLYIANMFLHIV